MISTRHIMAIFLLLVFQKVQASYEILSDAVLYSEARNAYADNDFHKAGLFFYAFLQRDNSIIQIESNRREVEDILTFINTYIDSKMNPSGVSFHMRKPPGPTFNLKTKHCDKPTKPRLVFPVENGSLPNHHYGEGVPWRFKWSKSFCEGAPSLIIDYT